MPFPVRGDIGGATEPTISSKWGHRSQPHAHSRLSAESRSMGVNFRLRPKWIYSAGPAAARPFGFVGPFFWQLFFISSLNRVRRWHSASRAAGCVSKCLFAYGDGALRKDRFPKLPNAPAAPFPPTSHFGPGVSWPVPEPPASFPAEEAATVTSRKPGGGRTLASPGHQAHLLATAHTFCQAQVTPTLTSTSTAPLPPST